MLFGLDDVTIKDGRIIIRGIAYVFKDYGYCPCTRCSGELVPIQTMRNHVSSHNKTKWGKNKTYYQEIKCSDPVRRLQREEADEVQEAPRFPVTGDAEVAYDFYDPPQEENSPLNDNINDNQVDESFQDEVRNVSDEEDVLEDWGASSDSSSDEDLNVDEQGQQAHDQDEIPELLFCENDQRIMESWMRRCLNGSLREILPNFLDWILESNIPKVHLNSLLDLLSPIGFPTANEIRGVIRRLGLRSMIRVTCPEEHEVKDESYRGKICGSQCDGNAGPCKLKMTKCIRQDSISNILRRKLLHPEFASMLRHPFKRSEWSSPNLDKLSSIWDGDFIQRMRRDESLSHFFRTNDQSYCPIVFGIFADAMSPFGGSNNSIFHVLLVCYNLPPEIRYKKENIQVLMLVDGPKEPIKFQKYFSSIIDEACALWDEPICLYDSSQRRRVQFRVAIINLICDGRAVRACASHSEAGSLYPCTKCNIKGTYNVPSVKYWYSSLPSLPADHAFRDDRRFGEVKVQVSWETKTHARVHTKARMLEDGRLNLSEHKDILEGIEGECEFFRLPYFRFTESLCDCLMHTFHNVITRFESMALGDYDSVEGRYQFQRDGILPELWIDADSGSMPPAPWVLESGARRKSSVRVLELTLDKSIEWLGSFKRPTSMCGDPGRIFQSSKRHKGRKGKKKAQPYKEFATSGLLSAAFLIGGMAESTVRVYDAIFYNMRRLLAPVLHRQVW